MSHSIVTQLAGILILGVASQWVAWRIRIPSILLLLATGMVAGSLTGWLNPDALFGELMLPLVSLSVAVILYEGGLNLKFRDLRNIERAFVLLTTVGVVISWVIGTLAIRFWLQLEWAVATLLGAILVVTGPTVIGPILRHLRLRGKAGSLLKWEGIIIDPVGATLAVLVFAMIEADAVHEGFVQVTMYLLLTIIVGTIAGFVGALILLVVARRYWLPDELHNPVSLMLMFAAFTAANLIQEESGLLAVTVMGIALANQKKVAIRHMVEFKENLTILLISCLFIVLSARIELSRLQNLGWGTVGFIATMVLVARPLSVLASCWKSSLSWQEKTFVACMAPRGIVAAAISTVFALKLVSEGYPSAMQIVPLTFVMVFVTVLIYGMSAAPLARWLGLTQINPQGILFVGADPWVRELAKSLQQEGFPVFLVDTNWENIAQSRLAGLRCLYGSALAEETREQIDYTGLGRLLAVTSNSEANSLACLRYAEFFGRDSVYQLPYPPAKDGRHVVVSQEQSGRLLFGKGLTFEMLQTLLRNRPKIRKTKITKEFEFEDFQIEHGHGAFPLFVLKPDSTLHVCTVNGFRNITPGDTLLSIVGTLPEDKPDSNGQPASK